MTEVVRGIAFAGVACGAMMTWCTPRPALPATFLRGSVNPLVLCSHMHARVQTLPDVDVR